MDALQVPRCPCTTSGTATRCAVCGQTAQVHLTSADTLGQDHHWQAEHVMLALPPRAWPWRSCRWQPPLRRRFAIPHGNARPPGWRPTPNTPLVYETPLLARAGSSGLSPQRTRAPGRNIDLSQPGGGAATVWFVGCARSRSGATVSEDVLRQHRRAQLARLFGPAAAHPVATPWIDPGTR